MLRRPALTPADLAPCPACKGAGAVESDRMPTRAECYAESEWASRALTEAEKEGQPAEVIQRLRAYSQETWTAYRAWVEADSIAAQAGCFG
jgi:hypothetical protein